MITALSLIKVKLTLGKTLFKDVLLEYKKPFLKLERVFLILKQRIFIKLQKAQ